MCGLSYKKNRPTFFAIANYLETGFEKCNVRIIKEIEISMLTCYR